jgi:hypothetical protein
MSAWRSWIKESLVLDRWDTTRVALRAHQRDVADRLIAVAAEILAQRAGMSPDDPEPQIAANALVGLWHIQGRALRKYLDGTRTPAQVRRAVNADTRRAARLIDTGLGSFDVGRPRS